MTVAVIGKWKLPTRHHYSRLLPPAPRYSRAVITPMHGLKEHVLDINRSLGNSRSIQIRSPILCT